MAIPPTSAGPLFKTRAQRNAREETLSNNKSGTLRNPEVSRYCTNTVDLLNRPLAKHRRALRDVSNGMVARQCTDEEEYSQRYRPSQENSGQANKPVLPSVKERLDRKKSGRGVLRNPTNNTTTVEPRKKVNFIASAKYEQTILPTTKKRTVKFQSTGITGLNAKPFPRTQKENSVPLSCEVTGHAIGKDEHLVDLSPSKRIRVIRRTQNSTSTLAMYRRKLQHNLDMKFVSDSTALPSDCVLRREGSAFVPHPPQSRLTSQHGNRYISRQGSSNRISLNEINNDIENENKRDKESDNSAQRNCSYRLAEKAEEYFTRNLRHIKENAPKPNVIKTYVVEGNPEEFLQKMDKLSPVSLTTNNLEMHNTWWTSLDTRESYHQKVAAREHRIRRWIEEVQSSSRFGHMMLVNIVVKDRGLSLQNHRDDVLERMSQVPSQIQSQIMGKAL